MLKFHKFTKNSASTKNLHKSLTLNPANSRPTITSPTQNPQKIPTSNPSSTKKGVASMYIVIFSTLIFGIITLSFVRIILSEALQTTNADLSRSAYDSALAGIEDGKVAVLRYHECLSQGYTADKDGNSCEKVIYYMEQGINDNSCDTVSQVLAAYHNSDPASTTGEVIVQENNGLSARAASGLDQAYTCVKIAETLSDYRSTLGPTNRTRLVPLRTTDEDFANFNKIRLQWYSTSNQIQQSSEVTFYNPGSGTYTFRSINNNSKPYVPPPMAVTFIQTDSRFYLNELSASYEGRGTDISRLTLVPASGVSSTISASAVIAAANKSANEPTKVNCVTTANFSGEFACSVDIEIPTTFNKNKGAVGSMFLVVSLLYGTPITDFSVSLICGSGACTSATGENGVAYFSGVQTSIDSTGRANDLYRRVETRLELYDVSFPYPEFELQSGDNTSGVNIYKNFYITKNCWWSNSREIGSTSTNLGSTCKQNNNDKGN